MGDHFMHSLIAEVKLQFSNKFVAIDIMKTPSLFGIQLWLEVFKLLTEKYFFRLYEALLLWVFLIYFEQAGSRSGLSFILTNTFMSTVQEHISVHR